VFTSQEIYIYKYMQSYAQVKCMQNRV